ncbi:DoxX family protein [Solitalea sp. MAHUQ-68]|uniref:DoxX family protein n=1 Tax=Solitalea agri TaxID=2953739 RepID=A0A9X2F4N9_9SPHI|nr:DoxX family protein [Solitalea agri]MCO4294095.1 DoxX family protein [Solitalea agri]
MGTQHVKTKVRLWVGRVLQLFTSLFLLFDAIMKIIKHPKYVEGTLQLGLPESCIQVLGFYLLLSTMLYIQSRTRVLGGLFLTAYLGGAAAISYAAQSGGHSYLFPIVFTTMIWIAEYLQDDQLKSVLPLKK